MQRTKSSSKRSAVTQPKSVKSNQSDTPPEVLAWFERGEVAGLSFHLKNWVAQKAKLNDTDPCVIVNTILDRERVKEKERCKQPFIRRNCQQVAVWRCEDKTWEQLLYDNSTMTFYLDWSYAEPADVPLSEALHWYGQKRALDADYGSLDWTGIELLITAAARELREWEEIQKRGFAAVQEDRQKAYAEFKQLAEKGGGK